MDIVIFFLYHKDSWFRLRLYYFWRKETPLYRCYWFPILLFRVFLVGLWKNIFAMRIHDLLWGNFWLFCF